jgi:RNA polymerase sigma factor (TIGR02999 family)
MSDEGTRAGEAGARGGALPPAAELFAQFYEELRAAARRFMGGERENHTLQPTALVNEAFIRLMASTDLSLTDRPHFLRLVARTMRHVLVDYARRKGADRHGGGRIRVTLTDGKNLIEPEFDLFDLDRALNRLARESERQASIIEMRYFAGLGVEEVAAEIDVSPRTVKSETRFALAWLRRELA